VRLGQRSDQYAKARPVHQDALRSGIEIDRELAVEIVLVHLPDARERPA
jgi:hypothetical protein